MLELKNIKKTYKVGDIETKALDGISVAFRKSEFVAILGKSGSGKTTCLNIIGGLDRYDSGDLVIKGKSTKDFKDRDWDAYRNNSVGFVFQSYNLIPHLTIVENVEMGMTLSGVSGGRKRKKALEVLEKVGLSEHLHKKPNQLSGGQTQRVAIARALANDPEILLCDEPTGALDSATSIQVMDLIKEVSKDRLVIMVTHNPELAERYADRIVRFEDGRIVSDSDPHTERPKADEFCLKKTGMSFFTALKLSFRNLMTKKGRTFMISFAGSIGIIGIALILSLSSGVDNYIANVEADTLSSYPLSIEKSAMDMTSFVETMTESKGEKEERPLDRIYTDSMTSDMFNSLSSGVTENDLRSLKEFFDSGESGIEEYVSDIRYGYSTEMNIYRADTENGVVQVNPGKMYELMYGGETAANMEMLTSVTGGASSTDVWQELISNTELLSKQYEIVDGRMPSSYDEAVLIVNENNEISDFTLYTLGIKPQSEVTENMQKVMEGGTFESEETDYSYDELTSQRFKLLLPTDNYEKDTVTGRWTDMSGSEIYVKEKLDSALEIKIVGIIRPASGSTVKTFGGIGYTRELTEYLVNAVNESDIVREQKADPDTDIFTGLAFENDDSPLTVEKLDSYVDSLPDSEREQYRSTVDGMYLSGMTEEEVLSKFEPLFESMKTDATYEGNLKLMGSSDIDDPSRIDIYPKDFESKDGIVALIEEYNRDLDEDERIRYTDYIGIMMSSVTTIINAISYILIAFVSISLVVSSIMIGIITYISVLERTKEIGILRSIGASKKDISRVFNAETVIIGSTAGVLGIGITLLLNIPINLIIEHLSGISGISALPAAGAVILIIISVVLTLIAGLVPSRVAAKKDPVTALRAE